MKLFTGLHEKISMDCEGFNNDGEAYLTLQQRGIHTDVVEEHVCFCFKNPEQMVQLRNWLNARIDEAGDHSKDGES